MKVKNLWTLVGASAPLILTGSTPADFIGLTTVSKPNEFGIRVCNVYVEFDQPGVDHIEGVAGTLNSPLTISVIGGSFFQHDPVGTDTPPNPILFDFFPELRYDTFVTIGVKSINEIQRNPLALTKCPLLDRTASR